MSNYHFFYNLNRETLEARTEGFTNPDGYLLSIHRYSPQMLGFAQNLAQNHQETILADNGYFERIRLLSNEFRAEANELFKQVKEQEKRIGHKAHRGDLSADLTAKYQDLAKRIRSRVYEVEEQHLFPHVISEQQKIEPHKRIVPEDILMATLVGLNIEPAYSRLPRRFYAYRNKRSGRFYRYAKQGRYGDYVGEPYAVASAVDYNSAFDAGRQMARDEVTHLAIGTGAFMADNDYSDHYYMGQKKHVLERQVPRRYMRTVLTAKGLMDGYFSESKEYPKGIHFLGLGTPIMMLMTGWVCREVEEVSFDATSPIKDALEGTLYVTDPTYLKLRARSLAHWYLQNLDEEWQCQCSYCQHYYPQLPFQPEIARAWLETQHEFPSKVTKEHLTEGGPLALAFPLFSEPRETEMRKTISKWRMGHNHLMLDRAMKLMNEPESDQEMRDRAEGIIKGYIERALPHFGYAIEHAWGLA